MAVKSVTGKLRKGGGKGLSGDALVGKVSQSTIDDIKRMGMTKALKLAGKNGATAGGAAREFQEGVRRMYGAKRLATAKATYAPVKSKSAESARSGATKSGAKPMSKPAPKPTAKSNTKSNVIKASLGTAAAVGALALSKGRAGSLASKLSPAAGKLAKSGVGKAVFGTGEKLTNKAFSVSGRAKAKVGGRVSQSQYDAMKAEARAKGIKATSPDAARKTATTVKPKKKIKTAKAGMAATGAGQTNKK